MKKDLEELRMDADGGDQQAMIEYGKALAKELRFSEAFQWLYSCKQLDDPEALFYLGICYYLGEGTEIDKNFAFHYFEKAAEKGYAQAQYNVGICYLNGDGVEKNSKLAFQWFLKAAEQGDILAQHNVGTCYFNGDGVEKDEKEAFQWFLKAAEQGYAEAQYNVGICYLNGGGVEKNSKLSFQWILKAAEQGFAEAQYNVGICYSDGDGVEKDEKEAFQWFLKAAKKKFVLAQYNVGTCYFNGDGVEKDEKEAFQWFLKAAEQGFAEAQFIVGGCYLNGVGVKKDEELAYHYIFNAAKNGQFWAQSTLGFSFNQCIEYDNNNTNVLEKLQKQAEVGDIKSLMSLAEMRFWGNDLVPKDYKKSTNWLNKLIVSDSNNISAKSRLALMNYFGLGIAKDLKKAKKLWQELGYSWDDDIRPDNLKELLICFVEGSGRNTFDTPECSLWDKLYIPLKRLNYSGFSNQSFEKFWVFCNKHHDIEPFPSISIDVFWNILMHYENIRQILQYSKKPAKLLKAVKEGMRDVFEELCEEEDRVFLGRVNVFFSIRDTYDLKYLEPWSIHTHNKDLLNSDFISYIFDSDAIKSKMNILNKKNNSNFSDDLWFAERTIRRDVASCIEAVDDVSGYYDYETRRSMNEILASPEFSEIVEYVNNENDETKDLCNESPSSKEITNTGAIEKAVTTKKKNGAPKLDKKKTIPETFSISDRNKMPITADDILKIYNEFTSKEHEKPILDAVNNVNVSGKGAKWFAYYLGLGEKPNNIKYPQKFEWLLKTKYKGEEVMDKSSFIDFLYIIGVQEEQLTMPRLYNNLFKIDKKFKSNVFTHIKNDIEEKKKTKDEIYRSERHDEIIERIRHAGVDKDKITPKNP